MRLKRKSAFFKTIVMLLVAIMLINTFTFVALAEEGSATPENKDQATGSSQKVTINEMHKNSFSNYLKKIADKPDAKDKIDLDFANAKISEKAEKGEYSGKNDVVKLNEGDSAELIFNVETAGVYYLDLQYCPIEFKSRDIEIKMLIDGNTPFYDANNISLKRTWKDKTEILSDKKDNNIVPKQEEVFMWKTVPLKDIVNYVNEDYRVYLEPGEHKISFSVEREAIALKSLTLRPKNNIPSYADVKAEYDKNGYKPASQPIRKIQAEKATYKTDSVLVPTYDRSSPATEPYHVSKIRRNTIGQDAWSGLGMVISYEFEAPESGLYDVGMKYRQCYQLGISTSRNVYIDNQILFEEMKNVKFKYSDRWEYANITDEKGNPCYVYLEKGKHTISFEATLGEWNTVLQDIDEVNRKLAELYRRIIMVTSANPDPFRDYNLQAEIPNLIDDLKSSAEILYAQADKYDEITGYKASQTEVLRMSANRIMTFVEKPEQIQERLSNFRTSVTGVSTWLQQCKKQPLEFDFITLNTPGEKEPKIDASFWDDIKHFFGSFFASFFEDYDNFSENAENNEAIKVWVADGRDQIQLVKDLINDSFTPTYNIPVNLSLIQGGLMEATLAGIGPDIALNQARISPVNYASRGALLPLDDFDTFNDVKARFADDALVPYQMKGDTYGIPTKQTFQMLFYRKDIFEELGLEVPNTWDEFYDVTNALQKNNMEVRLPYSEVTAAGIQDGGIGVKDIFATLFMQHGGRFYSDDLTTSLLGSDEGLAAFQMWTKFYTEIGIPLTASFETRFRAGEMPMGIDSVEFYNTLITTGTEIRGLWGMAPVPGLKQADGSINRSAGESGNASFIMKAGEPRKESCWKFLDWYTSAETQYQFGIQIENLLGPAQRYSTANLEAYERLPWKRDELKAINTQREQLVALPEVPGAYFMPRCIDNAFRDVQNKNRNPRECWTREVATINRELDRKNRELKTGKYAEDYIK